MFVCAVRNYCEQRCSGLKAFINKSRDRGQRGELRRSNSFRPARRSSGGGFFWFVWLASLYPQAFKLSKILQNCILYFYKTDDLCALCLWLHSLAPIFTSTLSLICVRPTLFLWFRMQAKSLSHSGSFNPECVYPEHCVNVIPLLNDNRLMGLLFCYFGTIEP